MLLDIVDVVQLVGERVAHVNDEHLPVGLAGVQQAEHAEDLDGFHLARAGDGAANLAGVEGVVVALGVRVGVLVVGVFPGLSHMVGASCYPVTACDELTCGSDP